MRRAVFLDRDGVINAMVYNPDFGLVDSPANPDEFKLLPGAAVAIRQINELGLMAIVVSNQPGVAKGKFTRAILDATTGKMCSELAEAGARLDGIYYCLHHPEAEVALYRRDCACRKPKPGLLFQAADELGVDLSESYMVGDGVTDVAAGSAAGTTTFLVASLKCYICDELARQSLRPAYAVRDLSEAVQAIGHLKDGDSAAAQAHRYTCRLKPDGQEEL